MKAKWLMPSLAVLASVTAFRCGTEKADDSLLLREWDVRNAPERMGLVNDNYKVDFYELPKEGSLSRIPWSGDYWPSFRGGISYRWANPSQDDKNRIYYDLYSLDKLSGVNIAELSPAEKYDIFTGDSSYSVTNYERKRTNVFSQLRGGEKIPFWFGLCHAWAPATLMYPNPGPVTLENSAGVKVPFGSSDIKALLTLYLHQTSSPSYFVSRRCNTDDKKLRRQLENHEITLDEYNAAMETADCQGVNPGAYHIILANMIGLRDQGFIADVTRGAEVWNQSVSGFKTRIVRERTEVSTQAAPGTVKEVLVETIMIYTQEITNTWDRVQIPQSNREAVYRYWLELDKENSIIGGLWVSDERPDFLWRRDRPSPEFDGKWEPLKRILEASTKDIADNTAGNQANSSNGGNQFIVGQPKWNISKFMFTYLVDLELTVKDDVKEVYLEIVKHDGNAYKKRKLKKRGQTFRVRNLPVAQWRAGGLNVIGKDASGKQLFSLFHTFTN